VEITNEEIIDGLRGNLDEVTYENILLKKAFKKASALNARCVEEHGGFDNPEPVPEPGNEGSQ